ncbi:MAG: DNA-processing protein DprA [Gammaproteobacteria bacterium]|nr:DNA-processing protein DprA [Gammaproteobacteria bacterium]
MATNKINKKTNLEYLLALNHIPDVMFYHQQKLLKYLDNLEEIFTSPNYLNNLNLAETITAQIRDPNWAGVANDLAFAKEPNHHIVTIFDQTYPPQLKEIAAPPLVLFVAGNLANILTLQIAVVGSRNPTPTGVENAYQFANELATNGITITSGFAMGIDTASHLGAIEANGATIAVMGTGLDIIYPRSNTKLQHKILEKNGTLVSEFPIGTVPLAKNFPLRNRIISGLSVGTLVVEATLKSGSLITAKFAAEQNREVFAVPGSINNLLAKGCHNIIRQGAKLVETTEDILEELAPAINKLKNHQKSVNKSLNLEINLDRDYKKLLECIGYEVTPIDVLIARSKLKARDVIAMLPILELEKLIASAPGGYVRTKTCAKI